MEYHPKTGRKAHLKGIEKIVVAFISRFFITYQPATIQESVLRPSELVDKSGVSAWSNLTGRMVIVGWHETKQQSPQDSSSRGSEKSMKLPVICSCMYGCLAIMCVLCKYLLLFWPSLSFHVLGLESQLFTFGSRVACARRQENTPIKCVRFFARRIRSRKNRTQHPGAPFSLPEEGSAP